MFSPFPRCSLSSARVQALRDTQAIPKRENLEIRGTANRLGMPKFEKQRYTPRMDRVSFVFARKFHHAAQADGIPFLKRILRNVNHSSIARKIDINVCAIKETRSRLETRDQDSCEMRSFGPARECARRFLRSLKRDRIDARVIDNASRHSTAAVVLVNY